MAEIRAMTPADAATLQALMAEEQQAYLAHFTAFAESGSLLRQCQKACRDSFFTLILDDRPNGFFCLRGLDEGYARPSFGVYVASSAQGRGMARAAVHAAVDWCRMRTFPVLMLKVSADNTRATRLYQSLGFVPVGVCPDSGQIVMEKRID